jgi:hypothetical protein
MVSPQTTDGLIPVKLYIKEIDSDNHGIFAVIKFIHLKHNLTFDEH